MGFNFLIYKKRGKWNIEDIWEEVHKHNNLNSLLKNISLSTLKRNKLTKDIKNYYIFSQ